MSHKLYILLCLWVLSLPLSSLIARGSQDSLLTMLQSDVADSIKVDIASHLISDYASTEEQIEYFYTSLPHSLLSNSKYRNRLNYQRFIKYHNLGALEKCEQIHKLFKDLDSDEPDYDNLASLSLVRLYFGKGKAQEAQDLLDTLDSISSQGTDLSLRFEYFRESCILQRRSGELQKALESTDSMYTYLTALDDLSCNIDVYLLRGRIYRQLGQIDSAEVAFKKALEINLEADDRRQVVYNNLGNIYHIRGLYDQAISYYMQSIEIKERRSDVRGLVIGYHNIGAIKLDMMDYEGCRAEMDRSIQLAETIDYSILKVLNNLKIGKSYQLEGNYESAVVHHNKALDLSRKIDYKKGVVGGLVGTGIDLMYFNQYETSLASLREGLDLARQVGLREDECSALVAIAEWYLNIDQTELNSSSFLELYEIEKLLFDAKQLSEEMDYAEQRLKVYNSLQKLYHKSGNSRKEAEIFNQLLVLKDSIYSEHRSSVIAEWETKYTTAEKKKEILKLETQSQINAYKNRVSKWIFSVAILGLCMLGYFGYKHQRQQNIRQRKEEAQQFRVKLSSDLHDDVGTLLAAVAMQSEIISMEVDGDQSLQTKKVSEMAREAMTRLRDTVWSIDSRKDTVEGLVYKMLEYLNSHLEGHNLQFEFDYQESQFKQVLNPATRRNLYLIFKEAVTNAAKYSNGDKLSIILDMNKNAKLLSIHDNGIPQKDVSTSAGQGLSNMKMRAKDIGGELMISRKEGYTVHFKELQ